MSGILLDTSAVIGCFERRSPTIAEVIARARSSVFVSVLTLGELHAGAGPDAPPARQLSLQAAHTMTPIDLASDIMPACYGFIARTLPRRIGRIDCWITATAVIGHHELVTQDDLLAERLADIEWSASPWRAPTIRHVPVGT